jgi:hypothetical protein
VKEINDENWVISLALSSQETTWSIEQTRGIPGQK